PRAGVVLQYAEAANERDSTRIKELNCIASIARPIPLAPIGVHSRLTISERQIQTSWTAPSKSNRRPAPCEDGFAHLDRKASPTARSSALRWPMAQRNCSACSIAKIRG